jgi:predicted NUDIX family NTP pyrophosphohydrolase
VTHPSSAGLLLFRRTPHAGLEVLVGHMGGPFWARKDAGAWTILKGEPEPGEDPYAAALREFEEELGAPPPASPVPDLDLGSIRQKSGKVVSAWAREGDVDPASAVSNTVEIEWPPRSGRRLLVPEIDRVAWFSPTEAAALVVHGQGELIERLVALVGPGDLVG